MITKYKLAKIICAFLPPIISQTIRNNIITISEGETLKLDFIKKSLTGSNFYGNTSDFHAFKFSIHGYFDWRNIILANKVLNYKVGDIIEVGANIGTETISFCDIAKKHGVKVYAFEPVSSNVQSLVLNKKQNRLQNLDIYSCLVSNKNGSDFFNLPSGNNSGSGYITQQNNSGNIKEYKVTTLDSEFKDEIISLISIDVEGFEYNVLKGAENLIQKNKPILVLEVNESYLKKRGHVELAELYAYLVNLNYYCYSINQIGIYEVDLNDFKVKSNKNWICVNKQDIALIKELNRSILLNAFNPLIGFNYLYL
ncbi:FkbM family methyltransferase [Hyunsoonleella aestuarii]|uniref:Methyltransferase FkbM domain-containing protein n=1 Tax=Hyunsoonleella aestuarii TaxID=912802 RepID=A0ABP8E7H4_9FLAO|nr:FkbM family methyltransferase [Hyunsoonleella aestuarii]